MYSVLGAKPILGRISRFGRFTRVVDGVVTATGVLSRQRGNLITIGITQY
jgi:hypothetical protein